MHIKVKQFSLRNIVFSILLIVMLLLSCLAGTLLISTNQNRNLVNQYVSETVVSKRDGRYACRAD